MSAPTPPNVTATVGVEVVGAVRTAVLTHRALLRQLVTRGRLAALLALDGFMLVAGFVIGASDEVDDRLEATVHLLSGLGLAVVVPIIALVFASAVLGDPREDGTLVYLWLRPLDRGPIVVGAYLAACTLVVPLTVAPSVISAALAGGGADGVGAALLASSIAAITYSALFVFGSLVVGRVVAWGLAYILLWEGLATALGPAAARLSVRGYTRAIVVEYTGVDLGVPDLAMGWAVSVPVAATVAMLMLAAWRLARDEVT